MRWQESRLRVVFEVGTGWHVYGRPIEDGYTPVTVEVASIPEVAVGPHEYPPTRPFKVEGLDDEFQVSEGRFEIRVPFAVNVPPKHGAVDLEISFRYHACSESECLPPRTMKLDVRLEELPPA